MLAHPQSLDGSGRPSEKLDGPPPLASTGGGAVAFLDRAQLRHERAQRSPWADVDREADIEAAVPGEPAYITACRCQSWRLVTWSPGVRTPSLHHVPARCRSWRHEGPCARWRASVDWRRIADAYAPRPRAECVFLVLTLARETSPDGPTDEPLTRWGNPNAAWPVLGERMWRLFHRLGRMACRESGCMAQVPSKSGRRLVWRCQGKCDGLAGRYVAVVEQHAPHGPNRERWPHLNIVVHWPWLARKLQSLPTVLVQRDRKDSWGRIIPRSDLLDAIVGSGWGYQSCAEIVDSKKKLASYLVKHAASVEKTAGEVAKLSQLPTAAPKGFRRIRSGRGFLAPRFQGNSTGALVRRDEHGNWFAVSRPREGTRTWVASGPPLFRPPGEPTLWLDMKNRRVYPPEWSGWAKLPEPLTERELSEWFLVCDVRGPP